MEIKYGFRKIPSDNISCRRIANEHSPPTINSRPNLPFRSQNNLNQLNRFQYRDFSPPPATYIPSPRRPSLSSPPSPTNLNAAVHRNSLPSLNTPPISTSRHTLSTSPLFYRRSPSLGPRRSRTRTPSPRPPLPPPPHAPSNSANNNESPGEENSIIRIQRQLANQNISVDSNSSPISVIHNQLPSADFRRRRAEFSAQRFQNTSPNQNYARGSVSNDSVSNESQLLNRNARFQNNSGNQSARVINSPPRQEILPVQACQESRPYKYRMRSR